VTPRADASPADETPIGVVLGRRYELRSLLGTGGSGAVYLAHDRILDRDVAVKQLRPGQDDLAQARLRAEARIAGALAHPGIARLLDFGEEQREGGAVPYLVMEYVDGRTLREVLRSGERLSVDVVLRLVGQIAEALAVVHTAGIVHRDLKPGNVMIARDGRAVLLDFGIARHHDEEPLTLTGTIVGTVDYISPEQAAGASATAASDLYSLGTLAYECLTGLRPLSRDTQVSTLMAHAGTPVPPLPPTFPDGVRDLVAAMVALDPAARPAGAYAVAQRVRELLRHPEQTRTVLVPAMPPPSFAPPAQEALVRAIRRRHAAAAACAAVLALAVAAVLTNRAHQPAASAAAPGDVTSSQPSASASATPSQHGRPGPTVKVAAPAAHEHRQTAPAPAPARHTKQAHGHGHGHGHGKAKHHGHGKG